MKFCVFGAGAIGGFVGGMVARGEADVSCVQQVVNRQSAQLDKVSKAIEI